MHAALHVMSHSDGLGESSNVCSIWGNAVKYVYILVAYCKEIIFTMVKQSK